MNYSFHVLYPAFGHDRRTRNAFELLTHDDAAGCKKVL